MPALSIVTVVKDDRAGLEDTLTSLRSQGSVDAELIVIDGSERPVGENLTTPFPSRVIHEPPTGIYPAMNIGLGLATGRYIYFLNAGDVLADDSVVRRILAELVTADSPVWAFGAVRFTDRHGNELRERPWDYHQELGYHFARGVFPAHQGIVAQTDIVRELGGFDVSYRIAADYALMLQLSQRSDPARWPWVIAHFQQGGASSRHWWLAQREFHRARRTIAKPRGMSGLREQAHTVRTSLDACVSRVVSSMKRCRVWAK